MTFEVHFVPGEHDEMDAVMKQFRAEHNHARVDERKRRWWQAPAEVSTPSPPPPPLAVVPVVPVPDELAQVLALRPPPNDKLDEWTRKLRELDEKIGDPAATARGSNSLPIS